MINIKNIKEDRKNISGFTLIEFLIVVGIIVILSSLLVLAINPGSQLQKARNAQRETHINAIHLALVEYRAREGYFPPCVTTSSSDVDGCSATLVPTYIGEIPKDPSEDCQDPTGYFVKKIKKTSDTDILGVRAECAEGGEVIEIGVW